jgi:hypothetical protein
MFELVREFVSLHYAGDFELPKITDCDEPGECHKWAGSQYIDSFAGVGTNWDYMGGAAAENHLHWDS